MESVMSRRTLVLLLVLALVAPIGPMPGFFIGGTPTEAPEQWGDTSNVDQIILRVPGTPPRAVIIWVVEYGGDLYVVGSNDSGWVTVSGAAAMARVIA